MLGFRPRRLRHRHGERRVERRARHRRQFRLDGPERCSGPPVCRYDKESLAAEFAAHFRLVVSITEDHVTPDGKVQRFQFCRLQRV